MKFRKIKSKTFLGWIGDEQAYILRRVVPELDQNEIEVEKLRKLLGRTTISWVFDEFAGIKVDWYNTVEDRYEWYDSRTGKIHISDFEWEEDRSEGERETEVGALDFAWMDKTEGEVVS
jgi:hypothetical protein